MYTKPMIFPLDPEGMLYVLEDETGTTVATGTREVCHKLLQVLFASTLMSKTTYRTPPGFEQMSPAA